MHKIIEFVPTLLRIVMQNDVDISIRLAGSIYLKNLIIQNWQDREIEAGAPIIYSIHEQDRAIIRENIVEAIVLTPQVVRAQLGQCVNHIIKYDFPGRWTQIVDKINIYLQNPGTYICRNLLQRFIECVICDNPNSDYFLLLCELFWSFFIMSVNDILSTVFNL